MGKLKFEEATSFGKVHTTSSVWDLKPVFSYLKAQCPSLLTCHFWAHITELESCGSFWRLDSIYILCETSLLSGRKVESESIFLFIEFKTDRHSSLSQRRLGTDGHMFASERTILPPTRGYLAHSPRFAASQASWPTFTGEKIPARSHSRVWAPQTGWDHPFRPGLL